MIYPNEKNKLYTMCQASIHVLEELWKMIEKAGMKDEQFVEDWINNIDNIIERYEQSVSSTKLQGV